MRDCDCLWWASLAALAVAGCRADPQTETPANETENRVSLPLPVVEPPMDRQALLLAIAQAASSAGTGRNDSEEQRRLDGKRFEVRLRFGCRINEQPENGDRFNVTFDEAKRTLRIRALPDLSASDPRVEPLVAETVEAVEGFWLRRPWLLSAECPLAARTPVAPAATEPAETNLTAAAVDAAEAAAEQPAAEPAAAAPRVGIAQFYTDTDARTGRRDERAYQTTKVLAQGEQPSATGYNLVLSGRLRPMPAGRVINCRVKSFDQPPDCIASAVFDRVWIEHPQTKAVVAEWGS